VRRFDLLPIAVYQSVNLVTETLLSGASPHIGFCVFLEI
jgi:hypothetical protein